ncbi:MAG: exopolyphosphatase [Gammaproteobacteria bacterium]
MDNNDSPVSLAAIDLGSNSFHMIVATLQDGQIQVLDRIKEPVRLASGLTDDHSLDAKVAERAIECLQRFGQRVRDISPENLRAVGTNTLRKADRCVGFMDQAQGALNHSIEVISGIEEARLIHLGVAHSMPDDGGKRLVVDIGGGSTELIIGEGYDPILLESLYMGCVNLSQEYFSDGNISKSAMRKAMHSARMELEPIKRRYRNLGWNLAIGSSGTIRAIRDVVRQAGWSDNGITAESLKTLRNTMIELGHTDALQLDGLSESRRSVFAGGVAVLSAVFDALDISRMLYSTGALREGVIYDLVGRLHHHDMRETTVIALANRYQVDLRQAQQVEATALHLLKQVEEAWELDTETATQWLHWASYLHEIGLVIAHSMYHKHGAYLIEHSDLPGFSQRDQRLLSRLVLAHRRKLKQSILEELPESVRGISLKLMVLLRLAVILNRDRSENALPDFRATCEADKLILKFPEEWLHNNLLTVTGLDAERKILKGHGFKLRYE